MPLGDNNVTEVLEYLLQSVDKNNNRVNPMDLLNEATFAIAVKCISRLGQLIKRLDKVEELLFNLEVSPSGVVEEQIECSRQVNSLLEVTRKFVLLVKDLDVNSTLSPERRRLLDLLESLSENDVDTLIELIEEKIAFS